MTLHRAIYALMTVASLICTPALTSAQTPSTGATSAPPPGKSSVKTDMVPSLVRAAGHLLTQHLLEEWTEGSFAKDPPNATVSVMSKDGASVRDAVVELKIPHLEGDRLTFDVRVLEGDLAGADGPASVFVDIIGLPFTPLSFAGVARRTARRAYWYGAATAGAAAAYGHPYYGPPPYYRPPPYYGPPY
jgi:hypothetical protein